MAQFAEVSIERQHGLDSTCTFKIIRQSNINARWLDLSFIESKRFAHASLEAKLKFTNDLLMSSGYPEKCIVFHSQHKENIQREITVPEKTVHVKFPFEGNDCLLIFAKRAGSALKRTFNAAILQVLSRTRALPLPCLLYTSPSPRDGLLSRMPSSA